MALRRRRLPLARMPRDISERAEMRRAERERVQDLQERQERRRRVDHHHAPARQRPGRAEHQQSGR